jgi:DNA-binding helix-hairpin-helix protein with protein kinase domain
MNSAINQIGHIMPAGAPMVTSRRIHAHLQHAAALHFALLMMRLGVRMVA